MKIYFSGYSDDNIEINGTELSDEIGAYDRARFIKLQRPNGDGLIVFGHYAPDGTPDGTWVFGVTLLGEDKPLPDWPITFDTCENGYSPVMVVDAPEDVTVTYDWEDD
jgi:hypothetical protein